MARRRRSRFVASAWLGIVFAFATSAAAAGPAPAGAADRGTRVESRAGSLVAPRPARASLVGVAAPHVGASSDTDAEAHARDRRSSIGERETRTPRGLALPLLSGFLALWLVPRRKVRSPLACAAGAALPVLLLAGAMLIGALPPTLTQTLVRSAVSEDTPDAPIRSPHAGSFHGR